MSDSTRAFMQTSTSVHSWEAMLRQRAEVFAHDQYALAGICLYVQVLIGAALYLYDHVSTPGYLSLLLAAPFGLLLFFLAQGTIRNYIGRKENEAGKKEDARESLFVWAAGPRAGAILPCLLAVCPLFDALLSLYALCAVAMEILPNISVLWIAVSIAGMTALSINGGEKYALSRLARITRWGFALALGYAAAGAVPYGNIGNLFPFLGYGMDRIGLGTAWLCGGFACCCFPLLLPQDPDTRIALYRQRKKGVRIFAASLGLGVFTLLFSAYLMPVYALARPETLGYRMLLISQVSPSLLGWSLLVCGVMLLLLFGLSAGVRQAGTLLACGLGRKEPSPWLIPALLILLAACTALPMEGVEKLLIDLAPCRAALALFAGAACYILSWIRKRREAA